MRSLNSKKTLIFSLFIFFTFGKQAAYGNTKPENDVYLVFVGPTNKDPAALFGHIFLVLEEDFFYNSTSFSFKATAADLSADGFISYIFKGLTGGYAGRIVKEKLYKMLRRYSELDDRTVYFFKLNKNKINIENLKKSLELLEDGEIPYYFFSYNCTSFFRQLIAENSISNLKKSKHFDYPIVLLKELAEQQIIELDKYWPSNYVANLIEYKKLTNQEAKNVSHCINNIENENSFCSNLNSNQKKYLSTYYLYMVTKFRKISYLNQISKHSDFSIEKEKKEVSKFEISKRLNKVSYPIRTGLHYGASKGFLMNIRPTYHDKYDFIQEPYNFSELSFLSSTLELNQKKIILNSLSLLKISSTKDFNGIDPYLSYKLNIGDYRNLFEENRLNYVQNSISVGVSKIYKSYRISGFLSPSINFGKIDLFSLTSDIEFEYELLQLLKGGVNLKYAPYNSKKIFKLAAEAFLTLYISSNFAAQILTKHATMNGNKKSDLLSGILYYF